MKDPFELAEEYCMKTAGFVSKQDRGTFLAGYEAAEKESGWISVKDRLPESGEVKKCFVCVKRNQFDNFSFNTSVILWHKNSWAFPVANSEFYTEEVTHWMPLPNLPEDI